VTALPFLEDSRLYYVTKTFDPDKGLSCCFRQHLAKHSHCQFLHGYDLRFKFTFAAKSLDARNWVIDFGGFKKMKQMLTDTFDHKLLVAIDDPKIDELTYLEQLGLADVMVMSAVGCEAFAKYVFDFGAAWLIAEGTMPGYVKLHAVEVQEHGGNSAIYDGEHE
jgi:6-pyruvoyltetrahydropterin/6-carboxytetrahydropterin synthase